MSIQILKTKTCAKCQQLAKYLTHKGKEYQETYIEENPQLQQLIYEKSGTMQVPFTIIEKDGNTHYVSGYNLSRINDLVL